MKKDIKLLIESFFDDIEDGIDTETSVRDTVSSFAASRKFLTECKTQGDVADYFLVNSNIDKYYDECISSILTYYKDNTLYDIISKICERSKKSDLVVNMGPASLYYVGDSRFTQLTNIHRIILKCNIQYMILNVYIFKATYIETKSEYLCMGIAALTNNDTLSDIIMLKNFGKNAIRENKKRLQELPDFNYFIKRSLSHARYSSTNTMSSILHETTYTSDKTYSIVQKDIDRMSKCILIGNYAGYEAISKFDKLIARLSAWIYLNRKPYDFIWNDENLLWWISNKHVFFSRNSKVDKDLIFFKDIVNTINAYKNGQ